MGQAKIRGTYAQRVAQAQERQEIERAASRERFLQSERERKAREQVRMERDRERGVAIVGGGSHPRMSTMLAMAAIAGLASVPMVQLSPEPQQGRSDG